MSSDGVRLVLGGHPLIARGGALDPRAELLVLGQLDGDVLARLASRYATHVVTQHDQTAADPESLGTELLNGVRLIVVRSPFRVPAGMIERAMRLRAIVRAGAGLDNIDVAAAERRGVEVRAVPGSGRAVAELAIGLLLAAVRRIPYLHAELVAGRWRKHEAMGLELGGRTMVIVGFGRIGRALAELASAFGMAVVAVDRSIDAQVKQRALGALAVRVARLEDALGVADVLALCCPLTPETRGMIGAREFARLKRGSVVLNIARDELVDEAALLDALAAGVVGGAAIDGFATPARVSPALATHPRVIVTPHIGAQTRECRQAIDAEIERTVSTLMRETECTYVHPAPSVFASC